jgi:hypothetical protein
VKSIEQRDNLAEDEMDCRGHDIKLAAMLEGLLQRLYTVLVGRRRCTKLQ